MSENLTSLFEAENNQTTTSSRGLSGTAQLTSIATNIALDVYTAFDKQLSAQGPEGDDADADAAKNALISQFTASRTNNDAMDRLIEQFHPLDAVGVDFLQQLDEETLESMLKSQQSKRSRAKGKTNTRDNYITLLTGAIAENLIRLATGKEKASGGARRASGSIDYTREQMEEFSLDQEKLKKEIRNVQSKKSTMKSKAGFDESDERYQTFLRVEVMLKDLRTDSGTLYVEIDTTKKALQELLAETDINGLHLKDSKELLMKIAALLEEPEEVLVDTNQEQSAE